MMYKIVIADAQPVLRQGVKGFFASHKRFCIEGQAASTNELMRLVKKRRPHLVIMDLVLPPNGLETLQILRDKYDIRVLIISVLAEDPYGIQALHCGADGFLTTTHAEGDEVVYAASQICRGQPYISPSLTKLLLDYDRQGKLIRHENLTPRQLEVLDLLAIGRSIKEIAVKLHTTTKTISSHRAHILKTLGITSNVQLGAYVTEHMKGGKTNRPRG